MLISLSEKQYAFLIHCLERRAETLDEQTPNPEANRAWSEHFEDDASFEPTSSEIDAWPMTEGELVLWLKDKIEQQAAEEARPFACPCGTDCR